MKLQDKYITTLCKEQIHCAIYLINGIKLSGIIDSFGDDVVILKDSKSTVEQLIYKHAISTIVPHKNL